MPMSQGLISSDGTMMTLLQSYETKYTAFIQRGTTLEDRISAAQDAVAGYAADAGNWDGHIKRDTTALVAYGVEIVKLGVQVRVLYLHIFFIVFEPM